MKSLILFWKKDIINKLIIVISVVLIVGIIGIVILLSRMDNNNILSNIVGDIAGGGNAIPTLVVAKSTDRPPTETAEVFPTVPGAAGGQATKTPALQMATPTPQPIIATKVLTSTPEAPRPTATPMPPTATQPVSTPVPTLPPSQAAACIPANPAQTGKVLDVIDGNTIKVMIDGKTYTVRYIGIDVPQYRPVAQYFGQEADFKNAGYVFAKQITLIADAQDMDENGRLLRYVKIGDTFVNYEMVRQGFATTSQASFACEQTFKDAEQAASQEQLGKWKPTPTLPAK